MASQKAGKANKQGTKTSFVNTGDWEAALNTLAIVDDNWKISLGMVFGRTGFENQLIDWLKLEIKLGSRPHFKLISYEETLSLIESYGKQKGDGFQEFLSSLEDILLAAKSELNETGQLSVTMLSKLIKLQIYIFKLENDPALKNDINKLNKPPEKEIKGSGKQKEVPKSKQTSSVNLFEPVRKGSVLQSRAKDYASLESEDKAKIELKTEQLNKFWDNLNKILNYCESTVCFDNLIVQDLNIMNQSIPSVLCPREMQENFKSNLYSFLAKLMFNVQTLKRQHLNYLEHLNIIHVPTYTEQIEAYQKKLLEAGIEFDISTINIKFPKRNYYESSLNKMPSECNTVPVILHFIVEQVVKIVEDDNECLHDIMEINEEDINSKEINDIFEDWQYKLCLKEFQPDEEVFVPIIINHGDNSSLMFQGCSENLKTQLTTIHNQLLHMHPVIQMLKKFPLISEHLRHKISAAYHQFYSLFQEHEISIAEIERVLKWVTFENMKLLTVCDDGTIVKGCQTYSVCKNLFKIYQEGDEQLNFSFAMIPVSSSYCNDGYILLCNKAVNQMQYNGIVSNFTIPRCFQTCPLTNRNSKKNVICECFNISNLPISCECGKSLKPEYSHNNRKNTVPTKNNVKNIPNVFDNVVNVNNYLYAEILNSNVLFQILYEAMEVFHCVDFFYYEQDHCYLAVFHNPCNSSHFNHTNWNVKLNSNIAVRNFQMHVLDSIKEWIEKEEEIFQSKEKKSEIQDVASVVTFPSTVEANRNEEWIPKIILESLKYQKHDSKSSIGVSLQTNEQIIKIARDQHIIKETQKKRTEILGTITEQFIETPSVEYAFNGYDLGNIMLHINGSTTHLFLADNGIISIEKYKYLYGRNRIKINVLHNNDELFIFPPVVSSDFDCLPAQFHAILSKDIRVTQVLKQHTVPLLTNDETHSSTEKASIDEQNLEINSGKDSSKFFTVKEEERTRMLLEVYITLASGLVVHIKRSDDDNPESKFIVRQMYFGECCEIKEWCRTITVDGTVIRTLKGNISQALKLDGTILTTNWSSRESLLKDETIFEKKKNIETASLQNVEIMEMEEQKNEINEAENVDDNNEPIWVCTFPDGVQCQLQKGKNNIPLEPILANIAIKPRTKEKYIIRDDDLQFAQSPNHYSIVHFPDGTRTTVHHKATDPKNMETIEIEHPKFIGVTINCVTGIFYLHILPDVTVTVKPNGHILYQHDSGMQIAFNTDGTALYTSKDKCGVCTARPFNTYIISPTNPICLEAYDCEGQKIEVQANGNYTMAKTKPKELIPNKKRYFVVYEDGSGMELLNEMEMDSVLEKTLNDPMTDVQVHNLPNDCFTQGVIIFHPLTRSSSDIWGISQNVPYKMDSIVPSGLTCNDLKPVVPDNKDFNYPFGFHVGNGLNIGSVKKQEKVPLPVCNDPELWIVHHYLKYRKLTPYLKRTFENKLEEFFLMKEYLCRQSIQAQVTEFRDANEQKLARSLLELAKATGHPQKCMRTSPMNGVTSDKEILEKKPSKRNNLQRSHSKKLAEIKAEIKEWQHNQKLLSQKNFPPYFHSQLRASQQMKIQPNMPKKKSSQSDIDVRLDKKEKTFPLLSVRKTINSFSADRFITSRFLKPKLLQQSAKSSQQKSSPQQIHEPYPTFDKVFKRATFIMKPTKLKFDNIIEGHTYVQAVFLKNTGVESSRFKVKQPPSSTGIRAQYNSVPVMPGMLSKIIIELQPIIPLTEFQSNSYTLHYDIEILTEVGNLYLPLVATICKNFENNNHIFR